ncbi:MAG: AAA family ATPase [Bacteroidetes bacterium]|jgi:chromosome segregation protein|nr:AAA family ATPase [Bacteroidota bacterium]
MKLLRLEMKGFKSFARDTSLHFNEKITGIVGPNGSGKSNVVDAIRWVLGEQKSSHLRLEKMGDVLFNGTKKRKPAPVAKVTVTFENDKGLINSEYNELSVTRILYRSGDSEYRINDVICRLKDIKSVLLDTGIGSNSYAIIALGMVDDILSDKDQARRKMFEQAAGISKYKTRKRETLNKLKLTTADLDRVEDLIHELNLTLKQQKKQARRAEKYLNLKEQYKSLSIDMAILNSTQARKDLCRLKDQLSQAQREFDQLNASIRKREAEIERKKQSIIEKESSVSQNQREMSNIVREIQSLENKRDITKQSITYNKNSTERLEKQIQQKKEKVEEFVEKTEKLRKKIETEESTLEQQRNLLADLKNEKEISQKNYSEIKSGRSNRIEKLQDIQQRIYNCKQEVAVLESRREDGQNQIQRIEKQISVQDEKEKALDARHRDDERELESLTSQLDQLLKYESDRTQQLEALKEKQEEKKNQAQDLERKYDALQNEHDLLKGLVEKLEGFPESTKFLMRSKKWNTRAALLSDVLVSSGDYRSALENYLERYLSYFIVDHPQDAVKGIQLLKESQNGKANFIVNTGGKIAAPQTPAGGAVPAADVVETDAAYQGLISDLLKNVFIVKDESVAFELSQKHEKYTF